MDSLAEAARILRGATKDKSYQRTPLGQEAQAYLRQKRKRLTDASYRDYERGLAHWALAHADLALHNFEPPSGTELLEDFMDAHYGDSSPRNYNKNLSILRDFFKWAQIRQRIQGDPTLAIERAKARQVYRTTFTPDQRLALLAACEDRRDRIALRLLLDYGIRKGSLRGIQFKHFDHQRRRLVIFAKGGKVRELPIPQSDFWMDLERHILDVGAEPSHYLLCRQKAIPVGAPVEGRRNTAMRRFPAEPMGEHGAHDWWYRALTRAGIVPEGTTSGERMHKARHTAGQRVLDRTGNLKAAQALLGHASISTTADIYTDWDIDQLAQTLREVHGDD